MTPATPLSLGQVQTTLVLPLIARAADARRRRPLLDDQHALRLLDALDFDFDQVRGAMHPIAQHECLVRAVHIDRAIRDFLARHPAATIVNLGCGLDTTFDRVDNGRLRWYDLDFPDVIELRRRFFEETERRRMIAGSILDDDWLASLRVDDNILFMAAGVFHYIHGDDVMRTFRRLADAFPASECVFDIGSPEAVRVINEKFFAAAGFDERAHMKWGLTSAADLLGHDNGIATARDYPMFKGMKRGMSLKARLFSSLVDRKRIMYMVHVTMHGRIIQP